MARRRLPKSPTREAQEKAFYKQSGGRPYRVLPLTDQTTLYSDIRRLIEQELAALPEEKQPREGAPAKLARAIRATVWLEHFAVNLSDAHGSRCVRALQRFLEYEAAGTPNGQGPVSLGAAETLAGTLVAYRDTLTILRARPDAVVMHDISAAAAARDWRVLHF